MVYGTALFTRRRIAILFLVFGIVLLLITFRLAWVQLVRGHQLEEAALDGRLRDVVIPARRGKIYDRQLRELAVSVSSPTVVAFPPEVKLSGREKEIASALAGILGMTEEEVYKKITNTVQYTYVRRKVEFGQADQIASLKLPGIEIIEENQRYYPNGSLAANLLGFAGIDNQGLEGIEAWYDKQLRGENGALRVEVDAVGREMPQATHSYVPPKDGNDLVLTIDSTIQYLAERELDTLMASSTQPTRASILVMDSRNGEILAMASRPTFDPNQYGAYPAANWRNPIVSDTYEPGSTFKIITAAAALEEGVVSENDSFYDPGYLKVGAHNLKCWRFPMGHGSQTFLEGVMNSCNPVFATVGLRLFEKNPDLLYKYIQGFGFGQPTGIDLNGEATGQMVPRDKLRDIYVATISIGQSVAVTPIQLVSALGAVANGGVLLRPHIMHEVRNKDGQVVERKDAEPVRTVISQQTASRLGLMLERVIKDGTGSNAFVPGYRLGGKTGTAQKPGPGGYTPGKYVSSFLGYGPVDDPRLVCLVVIDEPKGYPYYGGTVAAPLFQRVMEGALRYCGVPPTEPVDKEDEVLGSVPQVRALPVAQAIATLKAAGYEPQVSGSGPQVREQTPRAGASLKKGSQVILNCQPKSTLLVPDLTGASHSQALSELGALNLGIEVNGSGEVVEQNPVPYTEVQPGHVVQLKLEEVKAEPALAP